jgi:hypothetical protein
MVTGHHDLRPGQGVQPGARGLEFFGLRPLGQVAGNHYHVRRQPGHQFLQRPQQILIDAAKMQIG